MRARSRGILRHSWRRSQEQSPWEKPGHRGKKGGGRTADAPAGARRATGQNACAARATGLPVKSNRWRAPPPPSHRRRNDSARHHRRRLHASVPGPQSSASPPTRISQCDRNDVLPQRVHFLRRTAPPPPAPALSKRRPPHARRGNPGDAHPVGPPGRRINGMAGSPLFSASA